MRANRSIMSIAAATVAVAIGGACGGDGGAPLGCVTSTVAEQFIATTPLSALVTDLEADPPIPIDAEIIASGANPEGDGTQIMLSTTASASELHPVYQSALGSCGEFGRIDDGDVQTWQARDGDATLRVHFEEGVLTITETTG